MGKFTNKIVLVTGAGKGIGAAVSQLVADEGGQVAVFDMDKESAAETADTITSRGGSAIAICGDARDARDAQRAVDETISAFGALDGLAPLAGVLRLSPTEDVPDEHWRDVMETNVRGPFQFIRAAIPHLRDRGGSIVLAASAMAFASAPGAALYSASKGAIVAMTRSLAVEYASEGIRVNCVAPGTVRTPMTRELAAIAGVGQDIDQVVENFGGNQPMKRIIEAEEVAKVIAFLLSDDASAVTGSCYGVDAGLLAKL